MGVDVNTTRQNPSQAAFGKQRLKLAEKVERALAREGIVCAEVINALRKVPREKFVADALSDLAYNNAPLPIGYGQTISQPTVVALMIGELQLKPEHRVLDIGTGSGYAAAILAELVDEVYTVERYQPLAELAEQRFRELGYENIHFRHGDGRQGWAEHAPYDGIMVAAASQDVPPQLLQQLRLGGRLVLPVEVADDNFEQRLMSFRRTEEEEYQTRELGCVQFVPLAEGLGASGIEQ